MERARCFVVAYRTRGATGGDTFLKNVDTELRNRASVKGECEEVRSYTVERFVVYFVAFTLSICDLSWAVTLHTLRFVGLPYKSRDHRGTVTLCVFFAQVLQLDPVPLVPELAPPPSTAVLSPKELASHIRVMMSQNARCVLV